jgi:hypothetical protein
MLDGCVIGGGDSFATVATFAFGPEGFKYCT